MNHLECVTLKNNKWYWYLIVFFLGFLVYMTLGAIPLSILAAVAVVRSGDISAVQNMNFEAAGIDRNLVLFSMLFAFVCFLAAMIFLIKIFHNKTWTQVINGTNRVRWSRFFWGIAVWGIISLVGFGVSFFTEPESLTFRFDAGRFIVLLLIAVIFIPIQCTCEEFVFRGYLVQGIASWTKSRWWALIIPSVLFGLMHSANPEIKEYGFWTMMSQYIFLGLVFGLITLLDDGIEIAMGMHTVNNFLGCTLATYKGSALQTDALFIVGEMNPVEDLKWMAMAGVMAVAILALKYRWDFRVLNKRVETG
jgi:membrane protease YdiL (CAAX protease family)